MADDITRVIARILDGIKPASSDVRGRALQQFIAGDEIVYLRNEAVTVTVATDSAPVYDVAKYGRALYVSNTTYGAKTYGAFQYGE